MDASPCQSTLFTGASSLDPIHSSATPPNISQAPRKQYLLPLQPFRVALIVVSASSGISFLVANHHFIVGQSFTVPAA
jgi:hypothetical protein